MCRNSNLHKDYLLELLSYIKKIDQIVWTVAQCFIIPPSLLGQRFVSERGRASYASISWFTLLPTSPSSPPYVGNRFIENRQFVGLVFCVQNCSALLWKKCSNAWEKLEIRGWRKFFCDHYNNLFVQYNFWNRMFFQLVGGFSDLMHKNN